MPKDLTNAGGQFASKDATQNTTLNGCEKFIHNTPIEMELATVLAIRNDLDLGANGVLPYLTGATDSEIFERYPDIQMRANAGQIYSADNTLLRLFVQLPLNAPPVELDTTDRGKVMQPQAYVNVTQFAGKWAALKNAHECKALLDSVYPGPDNKHIAETAFPHKH